MGVGLIWVPFLTGGWVQFDFEPDSRKGNLFAFFGWNFIKKQFSPPEKWGIIYIRPHFWDDVLFKNTFIK